MTCTATKTSSCTTNPSTKTCVGFIHGWQHRSTGLTQQQWQLHAWASRHQWLQVPAGNLCNTDHTCAECRGTWWHWADTGCRRTSPNSRQYCTVGDRCTGDWRRSVGRSSADNLAHTPPATLLCRTYLLKLLFIFIFSNDILTVLHTTRHHYSGSPTNYPPKFSLLTRLKTTHTHTAAIIITITFHHHLLFLKT